MIPFRIYFKYFFFSWYGDARDLHSFPTRRSSDLVAQSIHFRVHLHDESPSSGGATLHPGFRSPSKPPQRDRKSTRLNSSHQIISYAVFCLKKKSERRIE